MLDVDVWADVRCPWCWIGLRRLRRAAAACGYPVRVRRRSFLLEPEGPLSPGLTTARVATSEWGLSLAQWKSKSQHIRAVGRDEGADINIDSALMFDSKPAHRLLKLAAATEHVDTDAAWDSAFSAHFNRNVDLGDTEALTALAAGWGLLGGKAECALADEGFAAAIAFDMTAARSSQVESVPTVVAAGGRRISGIAPVEDLARFLSRAGAAR